LYVASNDSYIVTRGQGLSGNSDLSGGGSFALSVEKTIETWIHPDGSETRLTTVDKASFVSPDDQKTWVAMGEPRVPQVGDTKSEQLTADEATPVDLTSLPIDPEALKAVLRTPSQGPGLRSALIEVLATYPEIEALGPRTDPLGRQGEAFNVPQGGGLTQVIFDAQDSAVLSTSDFGPTGGLVDTTTYQSPSLVRRVPDRAGRPL
jgi:hypothetical protein